MILNVLERGFLGEGLQQLEDFLLRVRHELESTLQDTGMRAAELKPPGPDPYR